MGPSSKRNPSSGGDNMSKADKKRLSTPSERSSTDTESESAPTRSRRKPAPTSSQSSVVARSGRRSLASSGERPTARKSTASNNAQEKGKSRNMMRARTVRCSSQDSASSKDSNGSSCESSSIPDSINERSKFNAELKKNKNYQLLVGKCKSRWNHKYQKREKNNPDLSIIDYAVDIEVATRKYEGAKKWDADFAEAGVQTGFVMDWIVGTGKRKLGEFMASKCLIKFTTYPLPSWEDKARIDTAIANASKMCNVRCLDLDLIEIRLRFEKGDAYFEQFFPNRYLKYEDGLGNGGYVRSPRSLYVNDLRALESRWNYFCARHGLPPLYIEDWTDEVPDFESLKALIFINYIENSPFVEEFIKDFDQLKDMKCGDLCSSCTRVDRERGKAKHCCGMEISVDIDEKTGEFQWCDAGIARRLEHCMHFECTDECECGAKCRNRPVQRGRQRILCIFREPGGKGWGVRTMSEMDKCQFVTEYIGEMNEYGMEGAMGIYDFDMAYAAMDSDGNKVHDKFVISAGDKGNESRYFNHSCDPNMNTFTTVIERHGLFYNRIAFFTARTITAGDELTFNYFPDKKLSDFEIRKMFPDGCRCSSDKCRWPKRTPEFGNVKEESKGGDEKENEEGGEVDGHDFEDMMMDVDDVPGGSASRKKENDGNDSDRTLIQSPPEFGRKSGGGKKKEKARKESSRDSRMKSISEESGDQEEKERERRKKKKIEEERRKEREREKKRMSRGGEEEEKERRKAARQASPSRLARKAVGRGMRPVVKRGGRVVSRVEEAEDLRRRMDRPDPSSDSSLSSDVDDSSSRSSVSSRASVAPSETSSEAQISVSPPSKEADDEKRRREEKAAASSQHRHRSSGGPSSSRVSASSPSRRRSNDGPSTSQETRRMGRDESASQPPRRRSNDGPSTSEETRGRRIERDSNRSRSPSVVLLDE